MADLEGKKSPVENKNLQFPGKSYQEIDSLSHSLAE